VTQPERLTAIAPGTPMWKAVPAAPGRPLPDRTAIGAGRVRVPRSGRPLPQTPAEAYLALSLGWEDLGVHART